MATINPIAHAPAPGAPPGADAEFDALAELFLGDPSRTSRAPVVAESLTPPQVRTTERPADPAIGAPIDLVVLGHLPVRSGPWIARYAAERAAVLRHPVALIRLSNAHITVDVIAPSVAPIDKPDRAATLARALAAAFRSARECIIAVDAVEELGLAARTGITSLTVLTGANEAAIVEAYRAIKALGAHLAQRDDEGDPVTIRIGVMGADAERAEQVRRKLSDATRAFVGRDVRLAAAAEKIEPTPATNLWRGDTTIEPPELLDQILIAAASAPPASPAPRTESPAPGPIPPPQPAAAPAPVQRVQPAPVRGPATAAPIPHPPPAPQADVLIPGLAPVAIPSAPCALVRFARDAHQHLHLVRHDTDSPEKALAALLAVEAWIAANRALIDIALGAPIAGDPVLHLVTTNPIAIRPLLATRIRVHAVAPATGPIAIVALN